MNPASVLDTAPVRALQLRVLALCWAVNLLDGFDIQAIAYAAPAISSAWGTPREALGAIFGIGMLGMAAGSLSLGPLSDFIGRRLAILFCLAIVGASMWGTAYAADVEALMALRFVTGLGIGGLLPALNTTVAEFAPDRHRNLMVSIMHLGYPIGATGCGFLAAWLIPIVGWERIFLYGGVLTLLLVPLVWLSMPESPAFLAARPTPKNLNRLANIISRVTDTTTTPDELSLGPLQSNDKPTLKATLRGLFSDNPSATLLLWVAYFCGYLSFYFLLSWIPTILVDSGLPLDEAIYAGVALNIGGGVGMVLLGAISSRTSLRPLVAVAFLAACVGMIIFARVETTLPILLGLTLVIGFFGLGGLIGLYSIAARIYPGNARATGVGFAVGVGRFGGIAGPVVGGLLIALGWNMQSYFLILGIPLLLAAAAVIGIHSPALTVPPRRT